MFNAEGGINPRMHNLVSKTQVTPFYSGKNAIRIYS